VFKNGFHPFLNTRSLLYRDDTYLVTVVYLTRYQATLQQSSNARVIERFK